MAKSVGALCMLALGFWLATDGTKAGPSASVVEKKFTDCLLAKARQHQYSSFDGGKSAIQLLGDCQAQWNTYEDACMASGDTDSSCTAKSAILAQTALKLLNK